MSSTNVEKGNIQKKDDLSLHFFFYIMVFGEGKKNIHNEYYKNFYILLYVKLIMA